MDFNKFVKDTWNKIFVEKDIYSIEYSLFQKNKESLFLFSQDIFNLQYFSNNEIQKNLEEKTIEFFAFLRTVKELSLKYKYKILNEEFLREIFISLGFDIQSLFTKEQLQKLTDLIYIYKNKGTSEIIKDILNSLVDSNLYEIVEYYLHQNNQIKSFNFPNKSLALSSLLNDPLWYSNINTINVFPVKLPYFSILKNIDSLNINNSFIYLYALFLLEIQIYTSVSLPKEIFHPFLKEPISVLTAIILVDCIFSVVFKDLLPTTEMIDRKIAIYYKFINLIDFEDVSKFDLIKSLQNLFDLFEYSLYEVIADFVLQYKYSLITLTYNDLTNYIINNWNGYNPILFSVIDSLSQEIFPKLSFVFFYNLILKEQQPINQLLDYDWNGNYFEFKDKLTYFYDNILNMSDFYNFFQQRITYLLNYPQLSKSIGFSLLQLLDSNLFNFVIKLNNLSLTSSQKWTLINFCLDLLNKILSINKVDIKISSLSSLLINTILDFLKPIYARVLDTVDLNILNIKDHLRNTFVIGDDIFSFHETIVLYSSIYTGKMFFNYKKKYTFEDIKSKFLNLDQYLISLDNNLSLDDQYFIYTPVYYKFNIYYGGSNNPESIYKIYPVTEDFNKIVFTDKFLEKNSFFIKTENDEIKIKSTNILEPLFIYLTKIVIPEELKNKWIGKIGNIYVHKTVVPLNQIKGTKITKTSTTATIPIIDKNKKITTPFYNTTIGDFIAQFNDDDILHFKNIVENNKSYFTSTQCDFVIIESTYFPPNDVPFIDFIKTKLEGSL